ncbi:MAG: GIY-YIG nuclease family protein [Polaromonas sp.]|nr:GIY-YIG nuclease family protein [Polaromonas sp.]MDP3751045.1 GIY-YIG nuclease family protein [Polaromonas sp.]
MLTKDDVLREIRRIAAENGGVAPGRIAFFDATGIRESDWSGRWWTTWGAAVREAGLEPQRLNPRLDDELVLAAAAGIVRKLGRFPTSAEIRFESNADAALPSHNTFRRFSGLGGLRSRLREFAAEHGLSDVAAAIPDQPGEAVTAVAVLDGEGAQVLAEGFVYLIKSGRHFKIGKANSVEARHRQLKIQLPQAAEVVHRIKTDDPYGIESYWHRRFADKRLNGEWFTLSAEDVKAFRRRKFM